MPRAHEKIFCPATKNFSALKNLSPVKKFCPATENFSALKNLSPVKKFCPATENFAALYKKKLLPARELFC
ncbi:MAG: hypothetical protein IJR52_10665 [Selenomonadaceae bacterium]|nr:hypothetical protein [Selenomonadaceae bacterium]